jgi:hypothetical protein
MLADNICPGGLQSKGMLSPKSHPRRTITLPVYLLPFIVWAIG